MPKVIVELSDLNPPYPLYSSPALTADIQEVKTPEEAFALTMAFKKACAIFNSIAVLWNDRIKTKKACLKNVDKEKIYIDIPGYPMNTIYLDVWQDFLWINFPSSTKKKNPYKHTVDWSFPVTPHAFYCVLRLDIKHITKYPTSAYDIEQLRECAPKLDELAKMLLAKESNETNESEDSGAEDESKES